MTTVHTGDFKMWNSDAAGYGLGWAVLRKPNGTLTLSSIGTFGHGGAFSTQGWVDGPKDMIGVFMTQIFGSGAEPVHESFREIANAAVIE
jgi:CubicO group peptidase (beta-lactamase class C family)